MGEQGAKSLRGGKMEDVIFAGTAGRPPLGRAEVSLTIDNTDGALPIDYTEVTITRTMFRGGGSEYAINGTSCRLLDVQELLSDSGLGREMHVIVGQGQLDTVLRATPEERRGFIEEAAGVLKHRRRKERALRKLETMELNLTRVQDLTGEIRRQLGPLGRQAEAARRAAVIQADARDARLRLLADDLVQLTGVLEQEVADETALIERRTAVEDALADVRQRLTDVERRSAEAAPELTRAHDRFVRLQSLRDRMESTGSVAAERVRLLSQDEEHETTSGRDPEELRAQAAQAREAEAALLAEVGATTEELAAAVAAREEAEAAYAAEQGRLARLARAAADRREGLAKLAGQVGARRSRIEAGEAEIGRPPGARRRRPRPGRPGRAGVLPPRGRRRRRGGGRGGPRRRLREPPPPASPRPRPRSSGWSPAEREAERDRSSATARIDALELSLRRKDGAATLLAAADADHAVVGTVAALLHVSGGHEAAVAAALGWASEALAVPERRPRRPRHRVAARLRRRARRAARGRHGIPERPGHAGRRSTARPCGRATSCAPPTAVRPAVEQLLERVALVPTAAHAVALVSRGEGITAVTADGDVFGPGWARGGSSAGESLLELQAAVDETRTTLDAATATAERARFALGAARERAREVGAEVEAALEALHESDARMAAVAEQLGGLGAGDAHRRPPRPTAPSGPSPRRASRSSATAPSSRGSRRAWPRPRPPPPRRARTPRPTSATASSSPPAGPAPPRPSCGSPCAPARSGPGR